jgi:hypothetical protein
MLNYPRNNKLSSLIIELTKALSKYGDLPVGVEGSLIGEGSIWRWTAINEEGYDVEAYPEAGDKPVEIFFEGY